MQKAAASSTFDVIVVGSGASGRLGGQAARRGGREGRPARRGRALNDRGLQGARARLRRSSTATRRPEVIRKTRPVQKDCYACTEWNYDWFRNDLEEPYTTAEGKPFSWQGRMQVVGGRTNVWGRQSYRFSDLDFKAASHDGFGEDWPLGYDDLAPYYDIVEDYVGITGIAEGVYELPDSKFQPADGHALRRAARPRAGEEEARLDGDARPRREHHEADQRPPGLPLLRPLRARLRDQVVLQLRVHHRGRRPRRPATARSCRTRWSTRS